MCRTYLERTWYEIYKKLFWFKIEKIVQGRNFRTQKSVEEEKEQLTKALKGSKRCVQEPGENLFSRKTFHR